MPSAKRVSWLAIAATVLLAAIAGVFAFSGGANETLRALAQSSILTTTPIVPGVPTPRFIPGATAGPATPGPTPTMVSTSVEPADTPAVTSAADTPTPGTDQSSATTLRFVRTLGIVDPAVSPPPDYVLKVPDVVRANEDFRVTITTVGSGCERGGDSTVLLQGMTATVIVFDSTIVDPPENFVCAAAVFQFVHEVTLRFTKPGEALIRTWGRTRGSYSNYYGDPVVVERRVMVQ